MIEYPVCLKFFFFRSFRIRISLDIWYSYEVKMKKKINHIVLKYKIVFLPQVNTEWLHSLGYVWKMFSPKEGIKFYISKHCDLVFHNKASETNPSMIWLLKITCLVAISQYKNYVKVVNLVNKQGRENLRNTKLFFSYFIQSH